MNVACYVRVSTTEQNLDRQLQSTTDYATDDLSADLANVDTYRDKSTGTNTERGGYREMMDAVDAGDVDAVTVHEISRLARSLQDLERTVSRVTDTGAKIHFVRDGLSFGDGKEQPMHRLQMQMLGAFAEWQARVKQMNTREGIAARKQEDGYHHGPAPLGFEKNEGRLVEAENYHDVVAVLDMVQKDELSKRKAAQRLDCSRSTIGQALDRTEFHGLNPSLSPAQTCSRVPRT
ncbi:recombinase family protein [Haloplanus salinarum]|uniref:recombinase family protein n=1 Tax=Haloplanus salinarum TaxID=1912324 RepID=UPI003B439ADF